MAPIATLDEYFSGDDDSRPLFEAVAALADEVGPHDVQVSKSQVAFRRRIAYAWAWRPGQYLRGRDPVPLVLTIGLRRRDPSPRWKKVVEPHPGRFTHHLEIRAVEDLDDEVRAWLAEAWEAAG